RDSFTAAIRARVEREYQRADHFLAKLDEFEKAYDPSLDKLGDRDQRQLLRGLPSSGAEAQASVSTVNLLIRQVDAVRTLLTDSRTNIRQQKSALAWLLTSIARQGAWPVPATTADGRHVAWVEALVALACEDDEKIILLHNWMRDIARLLQKLDALRA